MVGTAQERLCPPYAPKSGSVSFFMLLSNRNTLDNQHRQSIEFRRVPSLPILPLCYTHVSLSVSYRNGSGQPANPTVPVYSLEGGTFLLILLFSKLCDSDRTAKREASDHSQQDRYLRHHRLPFSFQHIPCRDQAAAGDQDRGKCDIRARFGKPRHDEECRREQGRGIGGRT